MTTSITDLRSRIVSLGLRIAILTLDIATLTTLAVSLHLYDKWIPGTSYPTTALQPNKNTDKTDWIVLPAIAISVIWTLFITIRQARMTWHKAPLQPGFCAGFELVCLVWLVACTIPAFLLRESNFKNLAAISNPCDADSTNGTNGKDVRGACMPHLSTLKKLQTAAYSVACIVAFLHLILLSLACRSMTQRSPSSDSSYALQAAAQRMEKGYDPDQISTHTITTTDDRRSESVSIPRPPRIEISEM